MERSNRKTPTNATESYLKMQENLGFYASVLHLLDHDAGSDLGGGYRGAQPPPPFPEMKASSSYSLLKFVHAIP